MARAAEQTSERILRKAYDSFYRAGFARVSVDDIAEAAGVTKKTLYYHFESKDALVGAVLDFQHAFALRQFQSWGGDDAKDAVEFVDGIFASLARWASRPRFMGSGFTRIVMECADLPGHPARGAARRHKRLVEDWMASRLESFAVPDAKLLAAQIWMLVEGCMVFMLIHGDTAYAAHAAAAARTLLERPRRKRAAKERG